MLFYTLLLWEEEIADQLLLRLMSYFALPYYETHERFGSSDGIVDFAALAMNERNITMPRSPHQVKELFITRLQNFDSV